LIISLGQEKDPFRLRLRPDLSRGDALRAGGPGYLRTHEEEEHKVRQTR
jgi:hypothetical protein